MNHFFTFLSDVDVKVPEEKSIMTYVAQFLQYSNDMPAPDDHLQVCIYIDNIISVMYKNTSASIFLHHAALLFCLSYNSLRERNCSPSSLLSPCCGFSYSGGGGAAVSSGPAVLFLTR